MDGGDGLQVQREAEGVLDKKLQTADKGWSFSLGLYRAIVAYWCRCRDWQMVGFCAHVGRIGGWLTGRAGGT